MALMVAVAETGSCVDAASLPPLLNGFTLLSCGAVSTCYDGAAGTEDGAAAGADAATEDGAAADAAAGTEGGAAADAAAARAAFRRAEDGMRYCIEAQASADAASALWFAKKGPNRVLNWSNS